jgi:hypothetical protein
VSNKDRYIPMSYFDSLEDARTTLREDSLMALEKQIEYLEWLCTAPAKAYFDFFVETYGGRKMSVEVDGRPSTSSVGLGSFLQSAVRRVTAEAPTYFVSRDMTEMIKMAAEEMPSEGLSPIDLLTESGFLYFHHPVEIVGLPAEAEDDDNPLNQGIDGGNFGAAVTEPTRLGIRAILWEQTDYVGRADGTHVPGVTYYLFTDSEGAVEARVKQLQEEMAADVEALERAGHEFIEPILLAVDPEEIKEIRRTVLKDAGPIVLYDFSGWSYGRPWETVPYDEDARPEDEIQGVHPVVDQARRLLLATWKMLAQKVVHLDSERPPRHMRRRGSRVMPETGDVVVIRLRREYHPEGSEDAAAVRAQEGDEPWYNHRFLVRGHWRRQPCGVGRSETKLIWIAPHIRGPEDRPLILKSKIYSLEA